MLTTLALATALAQSPAAPVPAATAKVVPMTVQVQTAAKADAGAQAWAKELRAALEARRDEFRLAKPGETPELVVRIDSVVEAQGDAQVMNGAIVLGKTSHPFNLSYKGDVAEQAEKLARNLRKVADQKKAAPASP